MPVFLLDENVHHPDHIIERCAAVGIEVLRVHQLGLDRTDDMIIYDVALREGYVLVTGNVEDFREQAISHMQKGKPFPGVILLQFNRYRNVEAIIRRIKEVAANYDDDQTREWWLT
jgi:predicted nuclease of predicted toxin-antitoxin system